jgi:hypothetical protein
MKANKAYFMVRAHVANESDRAKFDQWYASICDDFQRSGCRRVHLRCKVLTLWRLPFARRCPKECI